MTRSGGGNPADAYLKQFRNPLDATPTHKEPYAGCHPPRRRRHLRALRPGAMASWQQRAGRGDEGPEGYALGDVTRIGVQTIKDIFKGTADGTREITGGIKRRWQEEQHRDTVPLHMPYHVPYVSHVLPYCTYHT